MLSQEQSSITVRNKIIPHFSHHERQQSWCSPVWRGNIGGKPWQRGSCLQMPYSPQFMFHRAVCKNEEYFIPEGPACASGEVWELSLPATCDVCCGAARALARCLPQGCAGRGRGTEVGAEGWGTTHGWSVSNRSWEGKEKAEQLQPSAQQWQLCALPNSAKTLQRKALCLHWVCQGGLSP